MTDAILSLAALKERFLSDAQSDWSPRWTVADAYRDCADALTPLLHREAEQQKEIAALHVTAEMFKRDSFVSQCKVESLEQQLAEQQAEVERLNEAYDTAALLGQSMCELESEQRARAEAAESALSALRQEHEALKQQLQKKEFCFSCDQWVVPSEPTPSCDCDQRGNPDVMMHASDCAWFVKITSLHPSSEPPQ